MAKLFIFGLGYTATRIDRALGKRGWTIEGTSRGATTTGGILDFCNGAMVRDGLRDATHVLSTVPPNADGDPVLARYAMEVRGGWIGYLSSTGVYGDAKGAWVDESAPIVGSGGTGRRSARAEAEARWLELGARVFRLPGIYGPGRNAFGRIAEGKAHRIDLPGQVFSRVHVEDIASGVIAAIENDAPPGAYNLADDLPCSQNQVIEHACALMGVEPPPLQALDEAGLSDMARGFYLENRRVANGKAKRLLGWEPAYPTYREGLATLLEDLA